MAGRNCCNNVTLRQYSSLTLVLWSTMSNCCNVNHLWLADCNCVIHRPTAWQRHCVAFLILLLYACCKQLLTYNAAYWTNYRLIDKPTCALKNKLCGTLFAVASLADLVRNTHEGENGVPGPFFCTFCTKYFDSQTTFSDHVLCSEHKFNVSSDKEHQWNYRAPPWTASSGNFKLCDKWVQTQNTKPICNVPISPSKKPEWEEREYS